MSRMLLCITAALFFFISAFFNAEASRSGSGGKKSSRFFGHESKGFHTAIKAGAEDAALSITSLLSEDSVSDNYKTSAHHIVLFLGYGFSELGEKEALLAYLNRSYGLSENGGIISVLSYPEDVNAAGRIRISALTAKLKALHTQKSLTGFISAGAPRGTHTVLAALQDAGIDMPVFSLFSQDEVLGTEAGSALVFDYRPASLQDKEGAVPHAESDYEYHGQIEQVLSLLIQAALHWERIKDNEMLIPALRTEFFRKTGCSLVMYRDPVTGLRAKNHYVLTDTPKDKR